jgi:AmiR/NasT family two-component response regulator
MLDEAGYDVVGIAAGTPEAILTAKREWPDLVLTGSGL